MNTLFKKSVVGAGKHPVLNTKEVSLNKECSRTSTHILTHKCTFTYRHTCEYTFS